MGGNNSCVRCVHGKYCDGLQCFWQERERIANEYRERDELVARFLRI